MPSNRELIERAEGLGVELGIPVQTKGLNNAKLMALVENLEAKVAARDSKLDDHAAVDASGTADAKSDEAETNTALEADPPASAVEADRPSAPGAPPAQLGPANAAAGPDVVLSHGGAVRRALVDPGAAGQNGAPEDGPRSTNAAPPAPARVEGAEARKPRHPYAVADGRSLVVHRGVLGPGAEVRLDDVAGGRTQLDQLVAAGYLVRNEPEPQGAVGTPPARVEA